MFQFFKFDMFDGVCVHKHFVEFDFPSTNIYELHAFILKTTNLFKCHIIKSLQFLSRFFQISHILNQILYAAMIVIFHFYMFSKVCIFKSICMHLHLNMCWQCNLWPIYLVVSPSQLCRICGLWLVKMNNCFTYNFWIDAQIIFKFFDAIGPCITNLLQFNFIS